jgi:uncharacterized protein (TIGR03435 family)
MSRALTILLCAILTTAWCGAEGPAFDAASVKIAGQETPRSLFVTGGPGTNDAGRFHAQRVPMGELLARAFDVGEDQIRGPKWLTDPGQLHYNIDATMPPATTKKQFETMLQNLLIERFHLVVRHEIRDFLGYALVVDKGGPKFKVVTPDPHPVAMTTEASMRGRQGDDGFPVMHGPQTSTFVTGGLERAKYNERTMAEFVADLPSIIGWSQGRSPLDGWPRVIDKTGLTGKYTFILEYHSGVQQSLAGSLPGFAGAGAAGRGADSSAPAASDPGGPNIFTAIQKQLGLRLEKTADIPLGVIVVESVDKTPTEN